MDDLRALLVCPACRAELSWTDAVVVCRGGHQYAIVAGIPVLRTNEAEHDPSKRQQAEFFDAHVDQEFEVSRPHGTPRYYRWQYGERYRRTVSHVRPLAGKTVVTICGGSGMDAEFLAREGSRVISTDISLGACRRTAERARRHGLSILPVVADAESLPLADRSVDVSFVHDGLHHLDRPDAGLAEMVRVAAGAVAVAEPARARATALAARVGLAANVEEAGNEVNRIETRVICAALERAAFSVVESSRFAMVFRHEPGRVSRFLSLPVVFPLARAGWALGNLVLGPLGNKLSVQAVRSLR
jgi:SAM-dependent methyltransferase